MNRRRTILTSLHTALTVCAMFTAGAGCAAVKQGPIITVVPPAPTATNIEVAAVETAAGERIEFDSVAVVLDSDMLQPPQRIRDEFGMKTGETALYLARVRERNGQRFGYYTSWTVGVMLPKDPNIFEDTPRLAYFRENGLEITHVKQTLKAVGAQADAAEALGVEPGSPLLSLTRRSYNQVNDEEHLMDFLQVLYHPDRFQYRMDLTLDD